MTTSLDANIIIALLNQEPSLNLSVLRALDRARSEGELVVSGPVYAELLGLPQRTAAILDRFFSFGRIAVEWELNEPVWRTAGLAYQGYVGRRLASSGQLPRRILTDFLIGAHASVMGYRLLTMDKRLYSSSFEGLELLSV